MNLNKRADSDKDSVQEAYISVDIEAAGPIPGEYSMLSLGAYLVGSGTETFYIELQPINDRFVPEALKVGGLTLDQLAKQGRTPVDALTMFQDWTQAVALGRRLVFVGFNASFDWSFVNWYFHRFLGENPFGFAALDIKSFYMGYSGCRWGETTSSKLPAAFRPAHKQTHNALDDAISQGEIFESLLAASAASTGKPQA